jgi:hypothetical protein
VDVFLVSYYAKGGTGYRRFAEHMATRNAVRLHRTLWVMPGPTESWLAGAGSARALRDSLTPHAGQHDTVAVFELMEGIDWAAHNPQAGAVRRLRRKLGGSETSVTSAAVTTAAPASPDPARRAPAPQAG